MTEQLNNNSGWARILLLCNLYKELPLGVSKSQSSHTVLLAQEPAVTCFQTRPSSKYHQGHSFSLHGESGRNNRKKAQGLPLGRGPHLKGNQTSVCAALHRRWILQVQFEGPTFLPWLMMTHFTQNSFFLFAKTTSFVNKKNTLHLCECDSFWLASKALKTSFPLGLYTLTFFVNVQRPLGNATLNKAFFCLTPS